MHIIHVSFDVDNVTSTATVLAKMLGLNLRGFYLGGANLTHPSGTSLELTPRNTTISPSPSLFQPNGSVSRDTSFHIALTSPLSNQEVFALAESAGWMCQRATRGPDLPLIEVHVENRYLFEVYTDEDKALLDAFVASSTYYQRDSIT